VFVRTADEKGTAVKRKPVPRGGSIQPDVEFVVGSGKG
jgi:hypothetical protein